MRIRKGAVLSTGQKKQMVYVLLYGLLLLGAGLGVWLLWHGGQAGTWTRLTGVVFQEEIALAGLCYETMTGAALVLLCLFLLGFSAVGQLGTLLTVLGFGMCMGAGMSLQCSQGSPLCRGVVLLGYFVPVASILAVAAREALRFSAKFTRYGFQDVVTEEMPRQFRLYCLRFLVLLLFLLGTAGVYSVLFCSFFKGLLRFGDALS